MSRAKRQCIHLFTGIFLWPLVLGLLMVAGSRSVHAVTIGNVLDNTGTTAPGDMYQIPGLGRSRQRSEGSFVRSGTGTGGLPMTNGDTAAWEKKNVSSPTVITFPNSVAGHGDPWFSVNYVDKNDFIDFSSADQANQFYKTNTANYNKNAVKSLMTAGTIDAQGTTGPVLREGQSFDGGFLQVTGNVPIAAKIADSKTSVDSTLAGNWGVMVRVTLPETIDAKSLGGAIDWGKSSFYLTLDSIPLEFKLLGITVFSLKVEDLNFPLQFDHHVYLDKKQSNVFYLKVKGLPFNYKVPSNNTSAQMQLQRGTADYLDYLHNRYIKNGVAKALDNLTADGDNDTTGTGENVQPQFVTEGGGKGTVWDPFYGFAQQYGGPLLGWIAGAFSSSPVYMTGNVGRTISLLNVNNAPVDRPTVSSGIGGLASLLASTVTGAVAKYFVTNGFAGAAHINFSFDMTKYSGDLNKDYQTITAGRLMPAPYPDGQWNKGTGLGTAAANDPNRQAISIKLFGSNTLTDPYAVLAAQDRSTPNAALLNQMKAGTAPMDYAVIDEAKINTTNKNDARDFAVYTNFTSWTAFISPFDNSQDKDTLNSSGQPLGTDMRSRTARPDATSDGILANDGQPFSVDASYDPSANGPLTQSAGSQKLKAAGGIMPQRYTQVYQYYDYTSGTPVTKPSRLYTTAANGLTVKVANAANAQAGYTGQITKGFANDRWVYSGQYNLLPVAGVTLGVVQDLKPELRPAGDRTYVYPRTAVTNQKTVRDGLGTWRDRLAIGQDTMTFTTYRLGPGAALGSATSDQLTPGAEVQDVGLHLGDSLANQIEGTPPFGPVTAALQLPPAGSAATDNGFYGTVKLQRRDDIPINIHTAANAGDPLRLAANSPDLTATTDFLILLRDDTDQSWTVEHHYQNTTSNTVFFFQNGDKTIVTGTVQNKGTRANQTFQIMLPKVAGTAITGFTVKDAAGTAVPAGNITLLTNNSALNDHYQRYQVKMPASITQGQTFTFSYTDQATDITQMPKQSQLRAVLADADGKALAQTGTLYLNRMSTLAIMRTPTLDFGKHVLPKEQTTYALTADSQQEANLVVQDNAQATGNTPLSWTIEGFLSPFTTTSGDRQTDITLALGQGVMPSDYVYPTDPDWRAQVVANHTAAPLTATSQTATLFTLNTLLEPNTQAAPLTIGYPNARLTVPAVTKTGEYSATLTYTVSTGL